MHPDELLYPGSPHVFKRRWDRLLALLGVGKEQKLTPASLRTGGAIAAFRAGVSISDLLWRMRLRSSVTLEYYLHGGGELATNLESPSPSQDSRCIPLRRGSSLRLP